MQITETLVYPAAIEVVFDMMTDEAFHALVCEATHAMSHSATVSRQSDGATVITHREMPTDGFPEFARSMVGRSIDIVETIVYGPPGPHGTRIGEMSITMGTAPIALKGDIRIMPADDGTEVVGTLYGLFDGLVHFEEEDLEPLEVGRIDRLLIRRITEGPGLPAG